MRLGDFHMTLFAEKTENFPGSCLTVCMSISFIFFGMFISDRILRLESSLKEQPQRHRGEPTHTLLLSLISKYLGASPVAQGVGNGNPLQCSCLENPRDRGAWWLPSMGSHRVGHD